MNSDEVEGEDKDEEVKQEGRVLNCDSGDVMVITESSELEEDEKFREFGSVAACENKT